MTWAMCFYCGAIKFGAICPCSECQKASTGDMNLDITFSDHNMSKQTLQAFGEVVRSIREICDDDQLRFWSFMHYVSTRHPDILGVELSDKLQSACEEVLERANPPDVVYEVSNSTGMLRDLKEEGESDSPEDHSDE